MGAIASFAKQELLELSATLWRWFWRTTVAFAALGVVFSLWSYANAEASSGEQASIPARIIAGAALGLYYGVFVAAVVAGFAALWRLFGPALIVVLVIAPLLALGVIWLLRGSLAGTAIAFLDAVIASAKQVGLQHTAEAAGGMKLSCGGGGAAAILLVLLAPFLLADVAVILVQPAVLLAFLKFALVIALVLGAATFVALLFASPVLLIALVRRGRRRYQSGNGGVRGPAEAGGPAPAAAGGPPPA